MHSGIRTSNSYDMRNTDRIKDQALNCRVWMLSAKWLRRAKYSYFSVLLMHKVNFLDIILIIHNCIFRRSAVVSFINFKL